MTEQKKVSVIVPIYNVEKYLGACLQSISDQTYKNLEVLMINDGTKDNSAEIAARFAEKDPRFVLWNKENGGLSSARNYGLDRATGDFVCFIDSDDYIKPGYVEHFINKIGDSEVAIGKYVFDDREIGKEYVPYESMRINKRYAGDEKTYEIVERLMFDCLEGDFEIKDTLMPVWKNMYLRDFIENEGIRFVSERMVYMEDYIFNLEVYAKASSVKLIDDADYVHLNLKGTLSQSYRKNMFEMQMTNYNYACAILEKVYDEEMLGKYDTKLPYIIAYSAFKLSHCGYGEALANLQKVMDDERVRDVTKRYKSSVMPAYVKVIYMLLRHRMRRSIVVSARIMCAMKSFFCIHRMKRRA